MTKPWRNITTIWSDKKNCVFVFISVNLTGDSTTDNSGIESNISISTPDIVEPRNQSGRLTQKTALVARYFCLNPGI